MYKKIIKEISFKRIVICIEKIINEIMYEPLDSNTECCFINFLTDLFDKINIKPIIETSLNYKTKFIDTHIEFSDGRVVDFCMN